MHNSSIDSRRLMNQLSASIYEKDQTIEQLNREVKLLQSLQEQQKAIQGMNQSMKLDGSQNLSNSMLGSRSRMDMTESHLYNNLKIEIQKLKTENDKFMKQYADKQYADKRRMRLEVENLALQQEVKDLKLARNATVAHDFHNLEDKITQLQKDLKEAQASEELIKTDFRTYVLDQMKEKETSQSQIQELTIKNNQLETQLQVQKYTAVNEEELNTKNAQITELTQQVQNLQSELNQKPSKQDLELMEKISQMTVQLQNESDQLLQKQAEIDELNKIIKESTKKPKKEKEPKTEEKVEEKQELKAELTVKFENTQQLASPVTKPSEILQAPEPAQSINKKLKLKPEDLHSIITQVLEAANAARVLYDAGMIQTVQSIIDGFKNEPLTEQQIIDQVKSTALKEVDVSGIAHKFTCKTLTADQLIHLALTNLLQQDFKASPAVEVEKGKVIVPPLSNNKTSLEQIAMKLKKKEKK
ncbi:Hypothetical_protein [Hexamita inflata]|uniref:Hypothetical_protein n=1 Tax=Hexamita inflata TaxID=28002 RepID=A0AA86U3P3_9EUKA|nr:Hypothetical protein HINF_LOCUS17418 [Hexamita inflata]